MGLPIEINNLMLGSLGGYTVGRSLRFRSSASGYLSRAPATSTNRTTFTLSAWVKRGKLGGSSLQSIFGNANGVNLAFYFGFTSNDVIDLHQYDNGTNVLNILTTPVYRDPSGWYHILASVDTTQATASNRAKVYVNGVEVTSLGTATYPTQNYSLTWNQTNTHVIGSGYNGASPTGFLFDGYLAEVYNIDGQALTPSSFGAYDTNGVWQPKKYSGTYGTNGFYLPFSNTTSTTTLVQDSSGNGNNWTPNNISLTAGTTYDSMIDSPTVGAGASNYAVINPINPKGASTVTDGNLKDSCTGIQTSRGSSIAVTSGKWYVESTITGSGGGGGPNLVAGIGVVSPSASSYSPVATGVGYYSFNGNKYISGVSSAYGTAWNTNGGTYTIGIALDADGGTVQFYLNNVGQGAITLPASSDGWIFVWDWESSGGSGNSNWNFGQRPFSYTPPSGFKALNTYNLPAPSIAAGNKHFDISLWTGTGVARAITNSGGFQPDLVWNKSRNNAGLTHIWTDSVRGVNSQLFSPLTNAQETRTDRIQSFDSSGFTVGTYTDVNQSAQTFVGWQWKAGGTGVSNTSGTITSTVSANTTAGFSVVTWTGNGSSSATVGHGLGVTPNLIIAKSRSIANGWFVYHSSLSAGTYIQLNATGAANNISATSDGAISTSPTSTTFGFTAGSVGVNNVNQNTQTMVAYCFSAVSGYSAFGKYTGNGSSDGPFIYTGFRPRFIMIKNATAINNWGIIDTSRDTYNGAFTRLSPNLSNADNTGAGVVIDVLSNGFKCRNSDPLENQSGQTIIYAAFAESPFNFSRAR